MKKITFMFIFLICSVGFSQTNNSGNVPISDLGDDNPTHAQSEPRVSSNVETIAINGLGDNNPTYAQSEPRVSSNVETTIISSLGGDNNPTYAQSEPRVSSNVETIAISSLGGDNNPTKQGFQNLVSIPFIPNQNGAGPCENGTASNAFENAFSGTICNDVVVAADDNFLLEQIFPSFFHDIGSVFESIDVRIFAADADGLPDAGALISEQLGAVVLSQEYQGENFDLDISKLNIQIDPVEMPGTSGAETSYWVELSNAVTSGSAAYWELESTEILGQPYYAGEAGAGAYVNGSDGVFSWAGQCEYGGSGGGAPANDLCVDAITVQCDGVYTGETTTATDTGGNPAPDVWYSYSGAAGDITLSLCDGTDYDTYLRVFDACDGTEIASNDDSCSLFSELTFGADGTSSYYIMIEGYGEWSGNYSLEVSCLLGTNDNTIEGFSFYPNPATDAINLSSTENIERVTIYNILGQKVIDQDINATSSQLNVANLVTGAYLMQVSVDGKTATYKVLKN